MANRLPMNTDDLERAGNLLRQLKALRRSKEVKAETDIYLVVMEHDKASLRGPIQREVGSLDREMFPQLMATLEQQLIVKLNSLGVDV